jgi:hypothetical protein
VTTAAFDGTPESMDDVLAIGLDLGAWAKAGIAATSAEDPRSAGMIQMITMQGQTQLGLDPFETFLYPIGGTHVFARRLEAAEGTDPAASLLDGVMAQTTGGTFGNAILSLGVANSSAMADALKTAANKLLELIGQEIITSQRVGGTDVHTILSEPGSSTAILSLAAANNSLMIAATADSISQALATAAGDMKAFSSDRVFRRRMRGLPDGAFLLSYSRNLQMTPEEVSNLGETICNQLWSAGLYSQEKVRAAYEVYSKQPATEEKLDFRVDNRGWATWNGRHLLLRTDMTPIRE